MSLSKNVDEKKNQIFFGTVQPFNFSEHFQNFKNVDHQEHKQKRESSIIQMEQQIFSKPSTL